MKNLGTIAFLVVAFALGMVMFAVVYLGLVFGALDWLGGARLDDAYARRLGERVGIVAGVVGFPLGAWVAVDGAWPRLLRASGRPDWFARLAGLVFAAIVALLPLYASASAAFAIVLSYKTLGILAVVGFGAMVVRLEESIGLRG